jgi:hypothetical protein
MPHRDGSSSGTQALPDLHRLPTTSLFLTGVCMISAGFETTDPITQTRTVVIQGAREMSGRGWVLEVHCPQGAVYDRYLP